MCVNNLPRVVPYVEQSGRDSNLFVQFRRRPNHYATSPPCQPLIWKQHILSFKKVKADEIPKQYWGGPSDTSCTVDLSCCCAVLQSSKDWEADGRVWCCCKGELSQLLHQLPVMLFPHQFNYHVWDTSTALHKDRTQNKLYNNSCKSFSVLIVFDTKHHY